jgi:hypothetical protein
MSLTSDFAALVPQTHLLGQKSELEEIRIRREKQFMESWDFKQVSPAKT